MRVEAEKAEWYDIVPSMHGPNVIGQTRANYVEVAFGDKVCCFSTGPSGSQTIKEIMVFYYEGGVTEIAVMKSDGESNVVDSRLFRGVEVHVRPKGY